MAIGRALAMEPALLLLDEPSTGMNREEKEHLARFLLRIKHELGTTMLWVEHDMELVADLADSVTVPDKLWLNPDCGFRETPRWVTKEKLRALVEGARIVRKELSG